MIKINKPSTLFTAKAILRYKGTNMRHVQEKRFESIKIWEIDYNLREELLVTQTMFDGTEIMFSMISGNLFFKENGYFELKEDQFFCDFCLFYDTDFMVFEGCISYLNALNLNFEYKEDFDTTIILPYNKRLFDIWVKHNKQIQD
ncbi:hypothetical protein [Flavobacterium sp.]|jgi:hypothetical protein|uniref:hypothetical protein n=1 Tax=Flavobacterium sp. TaxID=239 RepID=UPI0037C0A138